jgi:hypothetical protein
MYEVAATCIDLYGENAIIMPTSNCLYKTTSPMKADQGKDLETMGILLSSCSHTP